MNYKAIVCDLDGTLLNENHEISQITKDTIKKVKELGIKFFIATGRHHLDAFEFKKQLGLNSYLISSNGAKIHDENNKEIYEKTIPADIVKILLDLKVPDGMTRHIYTTNHWYVEEEQEEYKVFHKESGFLYTVEDFEKLKNKEAVKIFFISKNQQDILDFENQVFDILGDRVSITLSSPECLEIMVKDVSKGEAIKHIMANLDIKLEEVMAFGDGLNDYEMLKSVGKGLLMGNCSERLKEKLPQNEIIKKNSENGVAIYLENQFLR